MLPETLEGSGPLVERADGFCVRSIQLLATAATHPDEADVAQHAEMLGDGRLFEPRGIDDFRNGSFGGCEEAEDFAAAGFGDGVEGVGVGAGSGHGFIIFRYGNVSRGWGLGLRDWGLGTRDWGLGIDSGLPGDAG